MVMTDPIADMLTRIRNAQRVEHVYTDVPSSKMKTELAQIMQEQGYIKEFKVIPDNKQGILRIYLKYGPNHEQVITNLQRVSKPGRRVYRGAKEIPRVLNKLGVMVVSTSKGLMTGEAARSKNLGGELICKIW